MRECQLLVCAAGKLNPVKVVLLKFDTKVFALFGGKATLLELYAVQLDAETEGLVRDASADGIGDLEDESCTVEQRAAVFVGSLVS